MNTTKIEWTESTWNPITGCSPVSEGCRNCYARRMAQRLRGRFGYPADDPFRVTFHPDRLDEPLRWKKPRMVFVCSMSDPWHPEVNPADRAAVMRATNLAPQHTYLFLTKRPENFDGEWSNQHNFWLGVTVENQRAADERIPLLLECPAAVRFLSCEPLLGPLELPLGDAVEEAERLECGQRGCGMGMNGREIDWVIVGAETGPGKRPMNLDWARSIRHQCQNAGVPFFFKKDSNGSRLLDGREWNERPNP